jgi:hypothetical protein
MAKSYGQSPEYANSEGIMEHLASLATSTRNTTGKEHIPV